MLVKVDNTTIPISFSDSYTPSSFKGGEYLQSNTLYWWHWNSTYPYDESRKATLFTAPMSWTYSFKIKAWQNYTNGKFWFGTSYDNILSEITPVQATSSDQMKVQEYTITINAEAWQTIYLYPYIQAGQNAGLWIKLETYSNTLLFQLSKKSNIVWYSNRDYLVWDLGIITIFWVKDNNFYIWQTTNTATTWNITPWNFVWYLQIWDYKIPYYL